MRMARGFGAVLLLGGALLAAAPGAGASSAGNLPAPTPPRLVSAVASGTGQPGQSRVTVTIVTTSFTTEREFFYVYGNGFNMALSGDDGFAATTNQQGGQTMTASFPICAAVAPEPSLDCRNSQGVDAMQVGSTITVKAFGQNTNPLPIQYTDESAPSNALRVTTQR
jgi:hypothetical protein